jgi:predicted porin
MKKSLLALAVMGAFSSAAVAQSSVTLFGIVDTGISYYKGDGNGNQWALSNSGLNSSRIGVRGSEDLGGGLKANFWFEAAVATDNGSGSGTSTNNQVAGTNVSLGGAQGITFNRRMFVGLSGGFGEVRMGRNYTPIFLQITSNDPFGTNGVGDTKSYALAGLATTNSPQTIVRASNMIEYLTPPGIGGVYAHLAYAFGENASNSANPDDGNVYGGRLGWAGGPVDVSIAYNNTDLATAATAGALTDYGIAFSLTFGAFKPMFAYTHHELEFAATTPERDDYLAGIVMTFGATDVRFSYNLYDVKDTGNDGQQFALGVVYNLSRRTAFYGTVAQMDNKGDGVGFATGRATTQPGGKTVGVDVGIRHSF